MIVLFVAVLLSLSPAPARADAITVSLALMPRAAAALPDAPDVTAGIERLLDSQLGSIVTVDFRGAGAGAGAGAGPGTGTGAGAGPSARVSVDLADDGLVSSTDFSGDGLFRPGSVRSLVSRVPKGSPSSLVATVSGDLAFLFFSARGLSTLPLSPPPSLVASAGMDALAVLTRWNPEELEPIGICPNGKGVTICFPHRYLTLGPLLTVTADTARDMQAQSTGPEPLQLSGVLAGPGGRLALLSERSGSIIARDPRLGLRVVIPAPGLTALPARLLGADAVVCLPGSGGGSGLAVYPLEQTPGQVRRIPVAASYSSALDRDAEGNLWTWDTGERRIRILTPQGREVYSIRPLVSASTLPLPQQLDVLDDGSFLLAGSSEVWKFQGSGIPVWRLTRIPGRPGEGLPPLMDVAVDRADGTFTVLDQQSRRLLVFSPQPSEDRRPLASALARLDSRKPVDLGQASALARGLGLNLAAWGLGDMAAKAGGSDRARALARRALLSDKAAGCAQLGRGLDQDLLPALADGAYLRAVEALRELTAEVPTDEPAAALLREIVARRRDVRAEMTAAPDVRIVSAVLREERSPDCRTLAVLNLQVRNVGSRTVSDLRIHAGLPALGLEPALVTIDSLPASGERAVALQLGVLDPPGRVSSAAVAALVTYDRDGRGTSSALSVDASIQRAPPRSPARALACRAVYPDTLAAGLADGLLDGPRAVVPSAAADLASVMDSLGAARRSALAETPPSYTPPAMRAALRGLGADEADWTVVTVSVAAGMGFPAAVLWRGNRPLALVDTGVPLPEALEKVPGLKPFQAELAGVSTGGTLWVPLSGRVAPPAVHPAFWSLRDGLEALRGAWTGPVERVDLPPTTAAPNAPVPFPLSMAAGAPRLSSDTAAALTAAALTMDASPPAPRAGTAGQ